MPDILLMVARGVLAVFAGWLALAAGVMAIRPRTALLIVGRAGGTPVLHWTEHMLRLTVGAAFVLVAPSSAWPVLAFGVGGFLAATSILILAAPRRWHSAYATACAAHIPPWLVRLGAPVSASAAAAVLYAIW